MEKRTNEVRGSAGGNCEVVRFNVVEPPAQEEIVRDRSLVVYEFVKKTKHPTSKFKGVGWQPDCLNGTGSHKKKGAWKTRVTVGCKVKVIKTSISEVACAVAYDNYIIKNKLNRLINRDIYGEYWKNS